jgi:hypothetical protein
VVNQADTVHTLAPDLELNLPSSFALKIAADGSAANALDTATGCKLNYFSKPGVAGVLAPQLMASVVASLQKRHPLIEPVGAAANTIGDGWQGLSQHVRAAQAGAQPLHFLVTALILPVAGSVNEQRNIGLILEVPDPVFQADKNGYASFAASRLRVHAAVPMSNALDLSLEPMAAAAMDEDVQPAVLAPPAPGGVSVTPDVVSKRPAIGKSAQNVAADEHSNDERLALAARGQKTVIYSIALAFFLRAGLAQFEMPFFLASVLNMALLFYAVSGVIKMCSGFGLSVGQKLAMIFMSTLPLVNIVSWLILSLKTTSLLRAAGYQVGLLGARE